MEVLPTLMELLTADLLIPLLPSLVTLATLSMETPAPRLVGVMGRGVGQLLIIVSVSGMNVIYILLNVFIFHFSGPCSDLPPLMNGDITYTDGLADSRPINTVATFTCDNGYTLTGGGGSFRGCQNDGTWSGSAPACQCEFHLIHLNVLHLLIQ